MEQEEVPAVVWGLRSELREPSQAPQALVNVTVTEFRAFNTLGCPIQAIDMVVARLCHLLAANKGEGIQIPSSTSQREA